MIVRNINGKQIAVDEHKGHSILLHEDDIEKYNIDPQKSTLNEIEIFLKGESEVVPFELTWEITNRCNLNCPFCYIHNHVNYKDVSFEIARPYLDEIVSMGLIRVTLTGGECILHKDFRKIYVYFKEKGVLVDIYTNGILLDEEIFALFDELPPNRVEMSIYDSITNQSKPYENALRLKNNNINVLIKCTVTTMTLPFFDEIREWCSSNKVDFKFDTDISDAFDGSQTSQYQIGLTDKIRLDKMRIKSKMPGRKMKCFSCGAGNVSYHINSNFELGLCCRDLERYPLLGSTFHDSYNEMVDKILKYKNMPYENCTKCFAKSICRMCYLRALKKDCPDGSIRLKASKKFCEETQKYYTYLFNEQ